MKFNDYLSSKAIAICFLTLSGIIVGIFLIFSNISGEFLILLFILYIILIIIWLIINYIIECNKINKMNEMASKLLDTYLLGEMIVSPTNMIEKQYYQIMKQISQSAIGEVEKVKREKEEYYEYVESWIHEIKTPLTACSLILANGGDSKKLKPELKKADNLTENILYYARMRTAENDTQIRELNVQSVIDDAIKNQMELLISSKIMVETEGDFKVFTDGKTLCFILKQLLINSAKYCPGCKISVIASDGVITIEDNGIGIPKHEIRRVTDRGFTGSNAKVLGGSTGMGLYIVNELCKRLSISLNIESEVGKFTRVILSFDNLTKL